VKISGVSTKYVGLIRQLVKSDASEDFLKCLYNWVHKSYRSKQTNLTHVMYHKSLHIKQIKVYTINNHTWSPSGIQVRTIFQSDIINYRIVGEFMLIGLPANRIKYVKIKFVDKHIDLYISDKSELKWGGRSECVGSLDFIPAHTSHALIAKKPIIALTGPFVFK